MELFPFQQQVIDRFLEVRNVFIGDDMGLGKSIEAIALDVARRRKHNPPNAKTLVVTPLAVIGSWTKFWEAWSDLRVMPINNKNRFPFLESLASDSHDVYIVHWPVLRLLPELTSFDWFHVIADECHSLQDRRSKQTRALKAIKRTYYKTGLSGTPAFDKPDDLWSVLNWLYPYHWSSYWDYFDKYVMWVNYNGYKEVVGVANEQELQEEMRGFYIRRRKEEVLHDLPDKYYTEIFVDLNPKQRRAYNQMRDNMLSWIGEHETEPVNASVVIAQLIRLQQFSCAYGKIEGSKMLVTEPSTKLDAVMEIIRSTDQQIVVFSQYSQVIELLEQRLRKAKIQHGTYIGATPLYQRDIIIDQFQRGNMKVFAGTIAAGGVGITLTAASTVVFIDRAWSHSLNRQAEDRLHRLGQKSAVQVIDIIAGNTLDTKRMEQVQMKWEWVKRLIGDDYA